MGRITHVSPALDLCPACCQGEDVGVGELLERGHHLATLREALTVTRARRGNLVLLAGEAGAGKTALLRRFCACMQ